ncbi:histidine biosynthesis trifunctional-protein [Pterulicium gracile]|uniref:Histidine biosynthesis trifunctional protein n=1 Tax=Pterulicium gracile TaxID=1884261 RepID=A0A5C3QWT1_9AGAR|nr:histidine biosynthesis trifunctional-protein [Pterula gracilis]
MSSFLPILDTLRDKNLIDALSRVGPLIFNHHTNFDARFISNYHVLADATASLDQITHWLDQGAEKVILPLQKIKEISGQLPAERLIALLDINSVSAVSDTVSSAVSGVLLKTPSLDVDFITSITKFFSSSTVLVLADTAEAPSKAQIRGLIAAGTTPVIPSSQITLDASTGPSQINIADAFLAPVTSDRPDGLFPTIVSNHTGHSMGLVYSSPESVKQSIITGQGVYQSRKHGLWKKGETSGAVQDVISVRLDCDSDALEFRVVQHGAGFCHLNRASCFGHLSGIPALEETLRSRFEEAPEGSYTKRLFSDERLLASKIKEEADELCAAQSPEDVAFEAADLFYFALTKCISTGVTVADLERSLDKKAKKVTRRPGNAKPQYEAKATPAPPSVPPKDVSPKEDFSGPIRMTTSDLSTTSPEARDRLLKRPVLRSDEMISKVKPIVDDVRARGDAALLDFALKFDRATLTSTVIRPPFAPKSMQLTEEVKHAIDAAYSNIRKFHAAQVNAEALVVETMPGVVCSRFSRPIERVGLYVPGGTAVLPSTALMLGVPAQVAGCKEIVLATPPRADGSVSPEVMYVAQLVGATAVLKAGGGQAVAAMAYGTGTVPKVDKIFGPGNQWVTAAKMLVQNDTDALVSIDMPAGPSEVLVIADETANPAFVAADLLSQAEHGVDSQVVLVGVALSDALLAAIEEQVDQQANALSRVTILRESVSKSIIVKASNLQEALDFSNDYAPEHLILHLRDAPAAVADVQNAGSVFVGAFTPESCGDYASGTNHTLPTNGYARQFSGVNTQSFQKHITSQQITEAGLKELGPIVATLADCEGLSAHANAVRVRLRAGLTSS